MLVRMGGIFFCLLFLFLSCAHREKIKLKEISLEEAIQKINENYLRLHSFVGGGEVFVSFGKRKISADFKLNFLKPDRVRIDVSFLFFTVASAVARGESQEVYIPMENRIYVGKLGSKKLEKYLGIGIGLEETMGLILGEVNVKKDIHGVIDERNEWAVDFGDGDRIWIDKENIIIKRYEKRNGENISIKMEAWDFKERNGVKLPEKILIEKMPGNESASIVYRNQEVNREIGEDKFFISVPKNAEIISIEDDESTK